MGSSRRGSRSRPRSRTLRRGLAPAYAVMIVLLIFIAYFILMKIYLAELWSIHNIEETYDIYRRKLEHTASLRIEDIRFIFVNEWNAKVLIEVMNIGFESINLSYVELIYKRCKVYNYSYSLTGELFSCVRIDTDYSPRVWTEDGDRRLYPGERGWIESSNTFDILWLYAYLNSNRTRYYIDLMIITDAGRTIHQAIAPKPGSIEVTIYVDNQPPERYDIQLYRLEAPGAGALYEFYNRKDYTEMLGHRVTHVELTNLVPGKYLMIVRAESSVYPGKEISIAIPITVDPEETENIPLILYTIPQRNETKGLSFWELDFTDVAASYIVLLRNLSYWWFEGDADLDLGASDYDWPGLKLILHGDISVFFETPRLGVGMYSMVVVYRTELAALTSVPQVNLATMLIDDKPVRFNLSCRPTKRDPGAINDWIECVAYANVTFSNAEQHRIELRFSVFYQDGDNHLRITRIGLYPYVGYRETVAQLVATLWPGDIYRVEEVQQGNVSKLVIRKVDEGRIAFYSCDNSSSSATPDRDPNDQYWFWRDTPSVRDRSVKTWLFNRPFGWQRQSRVGAKLSFRVTCSNVCYIYAYAMLSSYNERVVWPIIELVVDGVERDFTTTPGVFRLLRAELSPGSHSVSITAQARWYIATLPWIVRTYVDHILVVKNSTITITGLKPGYIVRIIDLKSGQTIYEAGAKSDALTIDAETLGIYKFPMKAAIQVIRS